MQWLKWRNLIKVSRSLFARPLQIRNHSGARRVAKDCINYDLTIRSHSPFLQIFIPDNELGWKLKWSPAKLVQYEGYIVRKWKPLFTLTESNKKVTTVFCPVGGRIVRRVVEPTTFTKSSVVCTISIEDFTAVRDPYVVRMPPGEVTEGKIMWKVGTGFLINKGELVCEVSAGDKSMKFFSPVSGLILRTYVPTGELVHTFEALYVIKSDFSANESDTYKNTFSLNRGKVPKLVAMSNKINPPLVRNVNYHRRYRIRHMVNVSKLLEFTKLMFEVNEPVKSLGLPFHGLELLAIVVLATSQALSIAKFKTLSYYVEDDRRQFSYHLDIAIGLQKGMEQYYPIIMDVDMKSFYNICQDIAWHHMRVNTGDAKDTQTGKVFTIATDLNLGTEFIYEGITNTTSTTLYLHTIHEKLVLCGENKIQPAPHMSLMLCYDFELGNNLSTGPSFLKELVDILQDPYKRLDIP